MQDRMNALQQYLRSARCPLEISVVGVHDDTVSWVLPVDVRNRQVCAHADETSRRLAARMVQW